MRLKSWIELWFCVAMLLTVGCSGKKEQPAEVEPAEDAPPAIASPLPVEGAPYGETSSYAPSGSVEGLSYGGASAEGVTNQGASAEGVTNQGASAEGVTNQGASAEGANPYPQYGAPSSMQSDPPSSMQSGPPSSLESYPSSGYGAPTTQPSGEGLPVGSDYGSAPNSSNPSAAPVTLMSAALKSFERGNETLAIRFAKAAALSDTEDAEKVLKAVRWSGISQQPDLITQVAVGYEIDAPDGVTEYNPIYYGQMQTDNSSGSGPRASKRETVQYPTAASTNFFTELEKAAGLMATELIEFMGTAHAEGAWMPLFAENKVAVQSPNKPSGNGAGNSSGNSSYDGSGAYASSYGGSNYGAQPGNNPAGSDRFLDKINAPEHPRIAAGLHYIGHGKTGELVKKAKAGKYQALVIFQIVVKQSRRSNFIQNECTAKLYNLSTGKVVATTRPLQNDFVAEETAKGKDTIVKDAMAKLLETAKKGLALNPDLPQAITAEIIKTKRLPTLTNDASGDKLDRVFEVFFWKSRGLLTEADFQAACEAILGADGTKLVTGTKAEKTDILFGLL